MEEEEASGSVAVGGGSLVSLLSSIIVGLGEAGALWLQMRVEDSNDRTTAASDRGVLKY